MFRGCLCVAGGVCAWGFSKVELAPASWNCNLEAAEMV